jgi:uncharacterized MAPEG superfamily protein
LRVLYIACYLADRNLWRSTVWALALGVTIALYVVR